MKKLLNQISLPLAASAGATLGALVLYQKAALRRANQKEDFAFCQKKEFGGIETAFEKTGCGKPLLLLHSLFPGACRMEWTAAAEAFSAEHTVYTMDLPGFGQSQQPQKPWTAYQYAAFLHDFVQKETGAPVTVLAANGSADLALIWSLLYPEDLEKLVLISPEGFGRGYATKKDMKPLKMLLSPIAGTQRFLEGTKKKRLRAMLEEMFYEKERLQPAFLDAVCQNARRGEHAQVMYAALKTRFPAAYTKDAFRQLEKPFLLIWGEKNASNPWRYMEEAEKERQKGEFLLFENTAALPHMENTAAFVRLTKEFLE